MSNTNYHLKFNVEHDRMIPTLNIIFSVVAHFSKCERAISL
jgi:hypothetical protein